MQICQQPVNCPMQQQSCTRCSTSPAGLPLGLSREMLQRPSLQMMLRLWSRLRLWQRTLGMRKLRSRQSRWALSAVWENASRTVSCWVKPAGDTSRD